MLKAHAKMKNDFETIVDNSRGHQIQMDLPPNQQGGDKGASPLEIMLMGYAGCTITVFKMIANKMRLNIEEISIDSEADKAEEEQTIVEVRSQVNVKTKESKDKLLKVLEMTEKNCPVGRIYNEAKIPRKLILNII